jgi:hypothetical protein
VVDKFKSRKFILACLFSLSAIIGVFTGNITGAELNVMAGLVLGLYGASNVAAGKVQVDSKELDKDD